MALFSENVAREVFMTGLPDRKSFIEGVRAGFMAHTVDPNEPYEQMMTYIFGPRRPIIVPIPSAEKMWAAYIESLVKNSQDKRRETILKRDIRNFPAFVDREYGDLVAHAWDSSLVGTLWLLIGQAIPPEGNWLFFFEHFGIPCRGGELRTGGKPKPLEEIAEEFGHTPKHIETSLRRGRASIRSSRNANAIRFLSGRMRLEGDAPEVDDDPTS